MNGLDKLISYFSPNLAASRQRSRIELDALANVKEFQGRYNSATQGRLTSWPSLNSDPKVQAIQLGYDSSRMRNRARNLYQNNLLASAIVERIVDETVQHGFNFRSLSKDKNWKLTIEEVLYQWFKTANVNGDDWITTLKNILRYLLIDGDVGIVLRNGGIQIVDSSRIGGSLSITEHNGNTVIEGVEINKDGKPIAFHIDNGIDAEVRSVRVAAKDMIYLALKKLPNQIRGESIFAQSFDLFDWLIEYTEASVVAAKMAACFAAAITTAQPQNMFTTQSQETANGRPQNELEIKPGMVTMLPPGSDIKTISASQPTSTYEQFTTSLLRQVTMACGITIEALGNIGQSSFSSSRMSVQIARNTYLKYQNQLITGLLERLYVWRVYKVVKDGIIDLKMPEDGTSHEWQAPGFRYYDPQTEYQANALAKETGQKTLTKILAENGIWLDEHLEEQRIEQELMRQYGIANNNSQMTQPAEEQNGQADIE